MSNARERFRATAATGWRSFLAFDTRSHTISPSRYIHTSDAETYRPIAEIVEELNAVELEARETDQALRKILKQLGVGG